MEAERAPEFDFGRRTGEPAHARVGTAELHSSALPLLQEAAVLFSAGRASAAIELLSTCVRASPMRAEDDAWRMLLELHQLTGRREDFESIAALYAARRGHAPRSWNERATSAGRAAGLAAERDVLMLDTTLRGALLEQVDRLTSMGDVQSAVMLDFRKAGRVAPKEAAALTAALRSLRDKGLAVTILESDVFEARLQLTAERNVEGDRAYWELLFELLILQRKHTDFAEVAMRYASSQRAQPPAWVEYRPGVDPDTGEQAYELRGALGRESLGQLRELRRHALAQAAIVADFAQVERIEYGVMGEFVDAVRALHATGKPVTFRQVSALIAPLLQAFGVDRLVVLSRVD